MGKEKKAKLKGGGYQWSRKLTWARNPKKTTFVAATPGLQDVPLQVWIDVRSGQTFRDNEEYSKARGGHVQARRSRCSNSYGRN